MFDNFSSKYFNFWEKLTAGIRELVYNIFFETFYEKKEKSNYSKANFQKKKKKKSSNQALHTEKVYSVLETPTQHTCGVSKTNEKLTNGLKNYNSPKVI